MAVILQNDRLTAPENHYIDYISGASQLSINILVSTHIFSGVRNHIKHTFKMLKHIKHTFKMVYHMPKLQLI